MLNPFFSGSHCTCLAITSFKNLPKSCLQVIHFAAFRSRYKIIISLRSSGMRRKQNIEIFELWHSTAVFTFSCRFFPSPLFFFSSAFSRLHFDGKSFWEKPFNRILGLEKDKWSVKQDFKEISGQCYIFFFLPFSPFFSTESYSFWYGWKDFFTLLKSAEKVILDR